MRIRDLALAGANRKVVLLACVAFAFGATNLISALVFDRIPHVQDSIAQLFHAKIFASGRLYAESHPLREFFEYTHLIDNGKWYSQYPPGHSFFLMLGVLVGAPWLVNPLLGTLSVVAVYFVGREAYADSTAAVAAVLMVLSPFFLFMSSGFMAHSSAMFATALFALFFVRTLRRRRPGDAMLAGVALGVCMLIRPYTCFGIALPFLVYAIVATLREPRRLLHLFGLGALCSASLVGILLAFNQLTNGHPLEFGYSVLSGPSHDVGFGRGVSGPPHTLERGLQNLWRSIEALSFHLFGWWKLSLLPIVFLLISGRMQRWCGLFFASFASLGAVYVFYWYHDLCFGPRYLYEALPFLVLLSARGIIVLPRWLADRFGGGTAFVTIARRATGAVVGLLFLYSAIVSFPTLIGVDGPGSYWTDRRYRHSYWGVDPYLGELVEARQLSNAVVFVDFQYPRFRAEPLLWYGSGFLHNSPNLQDDVIYARHLGNRNQLLMRFYPDREFYLYRGRLREGRLMRIE